METVLKALKLHVVDSNVGVLLIVQIRKDFAVMAVVLVVDVCTRGVPAEKERPFPR